MRFSLESLKQALSPDRQPGRKEAPALEYPLAPVPRVAVLGLELRRESGVHSLPVWTVPQLSRLRPMALAGGWADLAAVARLMRAGQLRLPELNYPLVVFTTAGRQPLSGEQHALLWEWFGLPVFEQIRAAGGRLLATECESREGFHLAAGADPGEIGAAAVEGRCPCGSSQPLYRVAAGRALAAAGD
jgi:hypothetical protein